MYFSKFPTTNFENVELLDITRKAKLDRLVKESALAYMNYTVQDGERPEDVAYFYYDDPAYAWLVLASNDIVDPYTDWPKTDKDLVENLKVKYASQANATGEAVLEWTKNATIGANIVHYRSHIDPDIKLNRASYINTPTSEFYPVRVYDYEVELNEARKEIVLVNKGFLPTIQDQLSELINA
jgi:hypothetical protein